MKTSIYTKFVLCSSMVIMLLAFDLPKGWIVAGSHPKSYDMGIANGAGRDGKNCATIQSVDKSIEGFGTLMQISSSDKYIGKRIRMTAYVKTEDVQNWCGLWLRCDGKQKGQMLAFDNMQNRRISGTTEWKKYSIVLDVPKTTVQIAFGTLLAGTGKVWFDEFEFEIVDVSVPMTGVKFEAPQNLSFEE